MRGRKMESRMCLLLETSARLLLTLLNLHRCLNGIGIAARMMMMLRRGRRPVLQRGRIRIALGDARPLLVLIQILERKHWLRWLGSSMMRELSLGEWLLRVVGHSGWRGWVGEVCVTQ